MDPTENIRKEMVNEINAEPESRKDLVKRYGQVWDTQELSKDYTVQEFMAPFVAVTRKLDGVKGI